MRLKFSKFFLNNDIKTTNNAITKNKKTNNLTTITQFSKI